MSSSAFVSEIYTSLQGEGPYTGEKQIFVRLAGCPLRCRYCDTPASLTAAGHPRRSVNDVLKKITAEARKTGANRVSVTGGEPLAQVEFLKDLLPRVKKSGLGVYLETAGVHPNALSQIVSYCDVIAMDIKLPSATGRVYWDEHQAFLTIGRGKIFVKVVVEAGSKRPEVERAVKLAAAQKKPPVFVLQPVTPQDGVETPTEAQIGAFTALARRRLPQVLVMPQQHKLWGVR